MRSAKPENDEPDEQLTLDDEEEFGRELEEGYERWDLFLNPPAE